MGRSRGRPQRPEHVPLDLERVRGGVRSEVGPGGVEYSVRVVSSEKTYTCPGCNGAIAPRVSHVVVWSQEHLFGGAAALAERRHWHKGCWAGAVRRGR